MINSHAISAVRVYWAKLIEVYTDEKEFDSWFGVCGAFVGLWV